MNGNLPFLTVKESKRLRDRRQVNIVLDDKTRAGQMPALQLAFCDIIPANIRSREALSHEFS